MFYIYILHSLKDGHLYTGYTPDLKSRFSAHQNGFVFATKSRRPFRFIHYEAFLEESDAKRRELYLKGGNGKKDIEAMLQDYFMKHPWVKQTKDSKPTDAINCPICGGAALSAVLPTLSAGVGEAPTKTFFDKHGNRRSGLKAFCLTCKGRGWVDKNQILEPYE